MSDHRYDVVFDSALALPGDRTERIARDIALVDELRRTGFEGPRYDMFENDLARAALPRLKGMLRNGVLITDSLRKWSQAGSPFGVSDGHRHLLHESLEQRDILAVNILLPTLRGFRRRALVQGGWHPDHAAGRGPGCLMTYFIGRCSWEFRQQYESWSVKQRRLAGLHAAMLDPEAFLMSVSSPDGVGDADGGVVLGLLRGQPSQTRAVLSLVLQGYEQLEIADQLQISRGAVANSIYRFRQKVLHTAHTGQINVPQARAYASQKTSKARRPEAQAQGGLLQSLLEGVSQ